MGFLDIFTGNQSVAAVEEDKSKLLAKHTEEVKAVDAEIEKARAAEAAKGSAVSGMAQQLGQGRRKRKGGKHTKKHRTGGKGKSRKSRR